ncbi:MAG: hypothetical protein GQ527_07740, partial [Bacteroidales bacterium]|nr:hypothetical protein [Bacteroidales bacterium]
FNQINTQAFSSFSTLLKMPLVEANLYFKEKSIDLLHIDGLHTYEEVKHDFELWLPKMSDRGVVLLSNINVKDNDFGVFKLMNELKNIYPSAELKDGHGLGIICTGKNVKESFRSSLEKYKNEPFYQLLFKSIGQKHLLRFYKKQEEKNIDSYQEKIEILEQEIVSTEKETKNIVPINSADSIINYPLRPTQNLLSVKYSNSIISRFPKLNSVIIKSQEYFLLSKYRKIIQKSGLFDEDYYLRNYPDVKDSGIRAIHHFIIHGGFEGRNPSESFDTLDYYKNNPDVQTSELNPLLHFIKFGIKDDPSPIKDKPLFSPPDKDYALLLPFDYKMTPIVPSPQIAVICHIFYTDLMKEISSYLRNIPYSFDLFITTDTQEKYSLIKDFFALWGKGSVEIKIGENRGRDIAPKLLNWGWVYQKYEFVLHIHGKKTANEQQLKNWRTYLYNILLGSEQIVTNIFEAFKSDSRLGMIAPQHFNEIRQAIGWGYNFQIAEKLALKMGFEIKINDPIDFPSGSMFWIRSNALKPILNNLPTITDFPEENGQTDHTIAHAIERLYFLICEKAGFKWIKIETENETSEVRRNVKIENQGQLKEIINEIQKPLLKLNGFNSVLSANRTNGAIKKDIASNQKKNTPNTLNKMFYEKVQKGSNYKDIDLYEFILQLKLLKKGKKCIIDFDEAFYLSANKDVAKMVSIGMVESGYVHFCLVGKKENRLWSNSQLPKLFNLNPHFPEGMFRPSHIKSKLVLPKLPSEIENSKEPYLLILFGHLQSDLFYAGYAEFFKDFLPVFNHFNKIDLAVESEKFEPELVKKYSSKIEVYNQKKLADLECIPTAIICFSNQMYTKAIKLFKNPEKLVYYCQEYEAGFFPYGTEFIEAERAVANSKNIIISTVLLRTFLEKKKLLSNQNIFVTGPEIERFSVSPEKNKKLFFYFRPEYFHTRNIPEILWETVDEFTKKYQGFEIYMIGSIDTRFSTKINGSSVFIINKLPKADYIELISSCDVVIAMIYSAHPGVIAFQAAASGIPTVTNIFENRDAKTLRLISDNIVPYDPIRDQLIERIEKALSMPKGNKSFDEELYNGKTETKSLSQFILNIKDND